MPRGNNIHVGGSMTNSVIGDGNQLTVGAATEPPPPVPQAAPTPPPAEHERYDLAFSFAGEDRRYVRLTKLACDARGLVVMYDEDLSTHWWGRDYIAEQRLIFGQRTRFVVPFISRHYFTKAIPRDEFRAAMWAGINRSGDYVLPVLLGDVSVPAEQLPPQIGYLRASEYPPERLAAKLAEKVAAAKAEDRPHREIGEIVPLGNDPHRGG